LGSSGTLDDLITARDAGLVACRRCGQVHPHDAQWCKRCDGANIYPMLRTSTLVEHSESTIIGGVVELIHHGSLGIAIIVFVASVMIPVGKFIAVIYLAVSVQRKSQSNQHERHVAYEAVEFIGRWSMIDVFVVAILSALVQLNGIATISPGIAAVSFALSVIFTMLSAQSFDARLIWDADRTSE